MKKKMSGKKYQWRPKLTRRNDCLAPATQIKKKKWKPIHKHTHWFASWAADRVGGRPEEEGKQNRRRKKPHIVRRIMYFWSTPTSMNERHTQQFITHIKTVLENVTQYSARYVRRQIVVFFLPLLSSFSHFARCVFSSSLMINFYFDYLVVCASLLNVARRRYFVFSLSSLFFSFFFHLMENWCELNRALRVRSLRAFFLHLFPPSARSASRLSSPQRPDFVKRAAAEKVFMRYRAH